MCHFGVPLRAQIAWHLAQRPRSRFQTAWRVFVGQNNNLYSRTQDACQRALLTLPVFVAPISTLHQRQVPNGAVSKCGGLGGILWLILLYLGELVSLFLLLWLNLNLIVQL